uniref:HMA domain-containing protein n=1 Tax=Panagrolaimus sp. JU765 TaxID=591449 RepID=A0AC34R6D0_9BILA
MSNTYVFNLDMTCESCANAAKRVLGKLGDKVSDVTTDVASKTVTVTTSLPSDEILTALKKTGKAVSLKA